MISDKEWQSEKEWAEITKVVAFSFIKHEYFIDIAARIVYEMSMLPVYFVSGPRIFCLNSCIPPYILLCLRRLGLCWVHCVMLLLLACCCCCVCAYIQNVASPLITFHMTMHFLWRLFCGSGFKTARTASSNTYAKQTANLITRCKAHLLARCLHTVQRLGNVAKLMAQMRNVDRVVKPVWVLVAWEPNIPYIWWL